MTDITCGVKINWSSLVFDILKDMVTPGSRHAKGYAIQICVLLKNVPGLELGESGEFPSSRILTEKMVHRYVVINEKVGGEDVANAPRVKKTPVKKAASKKRPATDAAAEPVIIEPTPTAPAEQPPVPKRKSQKRKKRLVLGSDDEIVDSEPVFGGSIVGEAAVEVVDDTAEKDVETVVESVDEPVSLPAVADVLNEGISTADDVDIIIEQVIAETAQIQKDEGDQDVDTSDVGEKTVEKGDEFITEPVEEMETEAVEKSADEALSLEDILMKNPVDCPFPSANMEITPITLGKSISIPGVDEGDWYKASLPKINPEEKGKAPLQFRDPIKGKPPKEIFSLILADIECLVQLREKVIDEVDKFFNSFSFKKLPHLKIEVISAKEALILSWAETDSKCSSPTKEVYTDEIQRVVDKEISGGQEDKFCPRDIEKKFTERFDQQDRVHRALRKDMHDQKNLMSLDHKSTHQKLSAQIAAAALDNVDVRKEVKEINTKVTYLDGQVDAIRSELFDFHAKAQENYLNLSSQLGFLVDYINRGGNDKKGEGSNSRPQPPPDDQSRPSGGNGGSGNRAEEQSRYSDGKSRCRGDRSGSSKRRYSSSGGGPFRRSFEDWLG
ncbi:hypothetical protein F511_28338 [Dorcoceras hygrometricum]|uniref:Uncharacterized protein n=1 Tax=Dorcoceras hygrometricum TaxID=472368 RepID=A0A2Z7CT30_9LAMI|nr:hypothetical protein F511_28338 [Dorcoceras hygrometricum]